VIIQTVEVKMIHTVVDYLFNGIERRDVPWLIVLILVITHVAGTSLRNAFGKRAPARRSGPSTPRTPVARVVPLHESLIGDD
jgi:hypothetical protein